jgi:hypothetical protein
MRVLFLPQSWFAGQFGENEIVVFEGHEKSTPCLVNEIGDETKFWVPAGAKRLPALVVPRISE